MKLCVPAEEESDAAPENSPSGDRTEAQTGAEGIWCKHRQVQKGTGQIQGREIHLQVLTKKKWPLLSDIYCKGWRRKNWPAHAICITINCEWQTDGQA